MAKLLRPYIPLAVRVQVAERQFDAATTFPHKNGPRNADVFRAFVDREPWKGRVSLREQLDLLLQLMFFDTKVELHHRPALINRFRNDKGQYAPDANDPDFLVYLPVYDHDVETRVRGLHGQYSDLGLVRKNKRIAKNRDPKKKIYNWPSRPFARKKM